MDLKLIVSKALSSNRENIFQHVLDAIDNYHSREVHCVTDMKQRDDKQVHGFVWEEFCKLWLLSDVKYKNVWHINEIPIDIKQKLKVPKQDVGIDLVGQTDNGYTAIQCKYRRKGKSITWTCLSTFVALCAETGPWTNKLVMTNCQKVSRKVATPSIKSLCYKTFYNTKTDRWLKFSDNYICHTISDTNQLQNFVPIEQTSIYSSVTINNNSSKYLRLNIVPNSSTTNENTKSIISENKSLIIPEIIKPIPFVENDNHRFNNLIIKNNKQFIQKPKTLNELREARLKRFTQSN